MRVSELLNSSALDLKAPLTDESIAFDKYHDECPFIGTAYDAKFIEVSKVESEYRCPRCDKLLLRICPEDGDLVIRGVKWSFLTP